MSRSLSASTVADRREATRATIRGMPRQGMTPEPDLSCDLVRLVPITQKLMRALLADAPTSDLSWAPGFPPATLLPFLHQIAADESLLGPFYGYVIVRQSDGLAVGDVGFRGPPGADGRVEIGYALVPAARGEGLATAAVRLLVDWATAKPEVDAVTARVELENEASQRLLGRLDFVGDGEHDGVMRFIR
jgi:RimJ/RimL family protein N-acetyltransferase